MIRGAVAHGTGENVLYMDGSVAFAQGRYAPMRGMIDDAYWSFNMTNSAYSTSANDVAIWDYYVSIKK
jgi:prepilin-type processing-associated H-X9-DG protein